MSIRRGYGDHLHLVGQEIAGVALALPVRAAR